MIKDTVNKKLSILKSVQPVLNAYGLTGVVKISSSQYVTLVIHDEKFNFEKYLVSGNEKLKFHKPVHKVDIRFIEKHWTGKAKSMLLEASFALRFFIYLGKAAWEPDIVFGIEILSK